MTGSGESKPSRSGWKLALFALPVLCCAGPALLAAIGAGSVGALLGGAAGSLALAVAGLVVVVGVAVIARRRARR